MKLANNLIITALIFLTIIFISGCTNLSQTQKIKGDSSEMVYYATPTEICCRQYAINESVYKSMYLNRATGNTCCDNTTDIAACNSCIVEQTELQKQRNIQMQENREKQRVAGNWYRVLAIIYIILLFVSFITLIVNWIVKIASGKEFLTRGWKIVASIVVGTGILIILLMILFILFVNLANRW